MTELTFPWPPTINTYWQEGQPSKAKAALYAAGKIKRLPRQTFLSPRGRAFREEAWAICIVEHIAETYTGSLRVEILAYPPDKRTRDLDNILKPLLDVLAHGKVIVDDCQIDELEVKRAPIVKGGRVEISVVELAPGPLSNQPELELPEEPPF